MRIRFTRDARRDLKLISDYLRDHAPGAADKVGMTIRSRILQLENNPYSGRATVEPNVRSLLVNKYPYTVYYRVEDRDVWVVHVRHQSRRPWRGGDA